MALEDGAKELVSDVKDTALEVNANFDGDIDTWLVRWAKSKVSGWIACGFGVALLAIGFAVAKVF